MLFLKGVDNSKQLLVVYLVIALCWIYFVREECDRTKYAVIVFLGHDGGGNEIGGVSFKLCFLIWVKM